MIRLLHTADWHIGQSLRGYSRDHEHRHVFNRLTKIVAEREIDALIVAGDIFDSQNPSGEAQQLFYRTLWALHRARPSMTMIIVAGNHDAAGRLEAPQPLLSAINAHVLGNVRRSSGKVDADRHLIPLATASGEIAAHVLAVSYPTAACLPPLARLEEEQGSPVVRAVHDLYEELFEAARPRLKGLPLIVTGHLHVAGGIESEGSERRILVGGQHAVPPETFSLEADYVALGHLHKAQRVGRDAIRYSGSLFPLSATEQPYDHGVTQVTLNGGPAAIEHVPIERPVAFMRVPAQGDARLDELADHFAALDLDADLPIDDRPYVQVRLGRGDLDSGYRAEVERLCEPFPLRVVDIKLAPLPEAPVAEAIADPLVRLADRQPEDLFRMAFQQATGAAPEASHLEAFQRVLAEV